MFDENAKSDSRPDEDRELAERLEQEHADAATRASSLEQLAAALRRKQAMCEAALVTLKKQKENVQACDDESDDRDGGRILGVGYGSAHRC